MVERLDVSSRHDEILGRVELLGRVRLQGKNQLVHKLYEHVVTFIQSQLVLKKVVHCPVLSSRPTDTVQHEKYSDLVTKLPDFEQMFQDFRKHIGTMKLISGLLIRFQLIPRTLLINTSSNSLAFRMTVT